MDDFMSPSRITARRSRLATVHLAARKGANVSRLIILPLIALFVAAIVALGLTLAGPPTLADGTCRDHYPYQVHDGHGHDRDGNGIGCESNPRLPSETTTTTTTTPVQQTTAYDRDDWAFNSSDARHLLSCTPYEHVDHIVALKEAHDSGGSAWTDARRSEFANDPLNLWCLAAGLNTAKSDHDLAEWDGGSCIQRKFIAERTVLIKTTYSLTTDAAESRAITTASASDCAVSMDADRIALIRLLLRTLLDLLG